MIKRYIKKFFVNCINDFLDGAAWGTGAFVGMEVLMHIAHVSSLCITVTP